MLTLRQNVQALCTGPHVPFGALARAQRALAKAVAAGLDDAETRPIAHRLQQQSRHTRDVPLPPLTKART